jgi:molybdenum cofactor guanylyltransferase
VSRAGYVLVGGASSRMGRDKALLPFRGGVLGQEVARRVAAAAGTAVLVGTAGGESRFGYAGIPDLYPGEGPLGGVLTALAHTNAEWNLVTACDMPGITTELLRCLLDQAEASVADAILPAGPSGDPEPLCAVYSAASRTTMETAFRAGCRKLRSALAGLRTVVLRVDGVAPFQNVNTPEDWAGYASK